LQSVSVSGAREWEWPPSVRNAVLGRMIGRVIAHEIGHWLLRWREHSASGLMRANQTASDLADSARRRFALLPSDVVRLKEMVARAHGAATCGSDQLARVTASDSLGAMPGEVC